MSSNKQKTTIIKKINAVLLFLICCSPIATIVLAIIGNKTDNRLCTIWSVAIYPVISAIAVPNAILRAVSDNRFKEDFTERKTFFDKHHTKTDDVGEYRQMILPDLIKTAIISSVAIIAVFLGMLYLSFNFYLNDGPSHLADRPTILRLFRPDYKAEGGIFLLTMLLLILGLPLIAHTIASGVHRISLFRKNRYSCYKVHIENVDSKGKLHVRTTKDINGKGIKHIKNLKKNTFDDFKCIGMKKEDIINKDMILVLIPGYAYILNV